MSETTTETFSGWCCVDCLMILANGEDNPEWSESEALEHHERMSRQCAGTDVTLGTLEHDDDCPNHPEWIGEECYCESDDFSWSPCDMCGSRLGGSRDAVTFWVTP